MLFKIGDQTPLHSEIVLLLGLAESFQMVPLWTSDGKHFVTIDVVRQESMYKIVRSEWIHVKPLVEVFDTCAESLKALKDVARFSKDEIDGIMEAFQEMYSLCSFLCFLQGTRVINDKTGEVYDRVFIGGDAIEKLFFEEEEG